MATTFTFVTEWMLDHLDPRQEHGGEKPPGVASKAATGYEWVRDQFIVTLHRDGAGLSTILPLIGQVVAGDQVSWQGGDDILTAKTEFNYTCLENTIDPLEPGFWRETIVWRWESLWTQVALSTSPFNSFG